MIKVYLFAGVLFLGACAHAQELRGETQSVRCGALAFIHTSLSASNPAFGEAMTSSSIFYGSVFSASRAVRLGVGATNGEVGARRELALAEFKKSWALNPDSVVREMALCNTWRAAFAPRVVALKDSISAAELVRAVGDPPEVPTAVEVDKWRSIVPHAFAAWAGYDHATPSSTRKKVAESLRQP